MKKLFLLLALSVLACGVPDFFATPVPMPTFDANSLGTSIAGTANAAFTQTAFFITPGSTPTFTPAPTPTPTATVTPAAILTAYDKYTIEYLRSRTYGGGDLTSIKEVRQERNFTTYLVKYPSDGLSIKALVSVPHDTKQRAVIVTIHGYSNANDYDLYQDSRFIDDEFVRAGFIVIHPAMRNYPPSDNGDNLFRVGQTIDILNLIAIIKAQSGQPGLLEYAAAEGLGLAGLSTGGGVTLRALTISPDVKAAVLYASISGDERRNVPLFRRVARDVQFAGEAVVPESTLAKISPASYYSSITAPILLAHGMNDPTIPLEWAEETCDLLKAAAVNVTCNFYEKMGHSFSGPNRETLLARAATFFDKYLR